MNTISLNELNDNMESARIIAGAEMERLCNNGQWTDACVFQAIRDSLAQNIQLLRSYTICCAKSEE